MPKDSISDLREAMRTKELAKEIGAPDLAQPGWYRLMGDDLRTADTKAIAEMSPEARRIFERRQRKAQSKLLAALKAAA